MPGKNSVMCSNERWRGIAVQFVLVVVIIAAAAMMHPTASTQVIVGRNWPFSTRIPVSEIDHDAWDKLLREYVDDQGNVDYTAWKASTVAVQSLLDYLNALSRADLERESPRAAQLAFWINAYNALTVWGILREYPTSSIQNHASDDAGYNIWRDLLLKIDGQTYSLGRIEHGILRKLRDPRIHFAIVCGARGCPTLRNEAYAPSLLDSQLSQHARTFFSNPENLTDDPSSGELHMSPLLDWYGEDFGRDEQTRIRALIPYLPPETAARMKQSPNIRLRYGNYDWRINDRRDAAAPIAPLIPPYAPEQ